MRQKFGPNQSSSTINGSQSMQAIDGLKHTRGIRVPNWSSVAGANKSIVSPDWIIGTTSGFPLQHARMALHSVS